MYYHAHFDVYGLIEALAPQNTRTEMLHRMRRSFEVRSVVLLAFHLRAKRFEVIAEGDHAALSEALRALKIGTSQALRGSYPDFMWGPSTITAIKPSELERAVARCHQCAGDAPPLSTPWSSHRDLMGLRDAAFFDAGPLRARVSAARTHRLAGGRGAKPSTANTLPPLDDLLRAASDAYGLLPADPKAFRLFVHLARLHGYASDTLARALAVTERRIRQLAAEIDPLVPIGLAHLHDARLRGL